MKPILRLLSTVLMCLLCFLDGSARSQSLQPRWRKDFQKKISWYVRTSPGILLVKVGKSLTAVDALDGRQLWVLPDIEPSGLLGGALGEIHQRGKNLLEVPGMGVLLLNRVKLPGDSEGRLIALNLMTGERLWDHPEVDELMASIPLRGSRDMILVSMRLERKTLATNMIVTAAEVPTLLYPFRVELQRLDPLTGKVQWSAEYPHTFNSGSLMLSLIDDRLFVSFSSSVLGSVDLADGHQSWEEGSAELLGRVLLPRVILPLPLEVSNGRLIYGLKRLQAVEPATGKASWEIDHLGKVTGISLCEGLAVALGEENVVAADVATGHERWRKKTHGHTTNVLWEKRADAIVYVDSKGLHTVDRTTGKSLLDANLHGDYHPFHIRLASPNVVVLIGTNEVSAYNLKTGKKILDVGKRTAFFPSYVFLDHWPLPDHGAFLYPGAQKTSGADDWESVREGTLLSGDALRHLEGYRAATEGWLDAYESEFDTGVRKIWWIDRETDREVEFNIADTQFDVSRQLGMVFAVDGNELWGAAIAPK